MIGGKELDLHILYVEVTRRGGFEKVRLSIPKYKYFFRYILLYYLTFALKKKDDGFYTGCCREEMEGSGCHFHVLPNNNKRFFCVEETLLNSSLPL